MGKKNDDKHNDGGAGPFTEEEAREAGMSQEEMNRARAEQEKALGNPNVDDKG